MTPTALITGAGRGLGRELAMEAARRGFRVYAGVRSRAEPFPAREILSLALDVTSVEQRRMAVKRIAAEAGKLDLLIHNAGINSSSAAFGPPDCKPGAEMRCRSGGGHDGDFPSLISGCPGAALCLPSCPHALGIVGLAYYGNHRRTLLI